MLWCTNRCHIASRKVSWTCPLGYVYFLEDRYICFNQLLIGYDMCFCFGLERTKVVSGYSLSSAIKVFHIFFYSPTVIWNQLPEVIKMPLLQLAALNLDFRQNCFDDSFFIYMTFFLIYIYATLSHLCLSFYAFNFLLLSNVCPFCVLLHSVIYSALLLSCVNCMTCMRYVK